MQIFYLDHNPQLAAQYHCDKHVSKMAVESAQLLSCVFRNYYGEEGEYWFVNKQGKHVTKTNMLLPMFGETSGMHRNDRCPIYYRTHLNNPFWRWLSTDLINYKWLFQLGEELCTEYTYRYGKEHGSVNCYDFLSDNWEMMTDKLTHRLLSPSQPILAMPEEYQQQDAVEAYRDFYAGEKYEFAKWEKGREEPIWFTLRMMRDLTDDLFQGFF